MTYLEYKETLSPLSLENLVSFNLVSVQLTPSEDSIAPVRQIYDISGDNCSIVVQTNLDLVRIEKVHVELLLVSDDLLNTTEADGVVDSVFGIILGRKPIFTNANPFEVLKSGINKFFYFTDAHVVVSVIEGDTINSVVFLKDKEYTIFEVKETLKSIGCI